MSKPEMIILCHHAEEDAGPLMVTIRSVFLKNAETVEDSGREDISYYHLSGRCVLWRVIQHIRRTPSAILLFNGVNSLRSFSSLAILLLNAHVFRTKQMVYWHDTAVVLRNFNGLEIHNSLRRLMRYIHMRKIWQLLDNTRTYHLVNAIQGKQLAMYLTGASPDRIFLVREAIDVKAIPVHERKRMGPVNICGAGIIDWRKGFDIFVNICGVFGARCDAHVVEKTWFGGSPEDVLQAKKGASGKKIEKYGIKLAGQQSDLIQAYSSYDLFLLTSRDDPFPLVGLMALACDMPVFCFDSTGMAEVLDDEFVCRSEEDMINKIDRYLQHRGTYEPFYFRKIAEKFDPGSFAARWDNIRKRVGDDLIPV